MLEVAFSCPQCSRMFLQDAPALQPVVPAHLDSLLGRPCGGSGTRMESYLEIPGSTHGLHHIDDWPRYGAR